MKPALLTTLWLNAAGVSQALVATRALGATVSGGYGHYATYMIPGQNQTLDWYEKGYTGHASVVTLHTPFDPTKVRNFTSLSDRRASSVSRSLSEERDLSDVCSAIGSCATYAADSTVSAAVAVANLFQSTCQAMYVGAIDYFSQNNYEKVKDIAVSGVVIAFAINIASTAFGNYYLNGQAGQDSDPVIGHDQCNASDPETMAEDYAAALYAFCVSIKSTQSVNVETHFTAGQLLADQSLVDGKVNVLKAFVAAQQDNFGSVCASLGVDWKRAIAARLRRAFRVLD